MKYFVITALIGISVILHFSVVHSKSESFTLEVKVISYHNPLSVAYRGNSTAKCCDQQDMGAVSGNCSNNSCDNFFMVCLREYNDTSRPGNMELNFQNTCESEIAVTGLLEENNDGFSFPNNMPFPTDTSVPGGPFDEVSNPIVLKSENEWTGQIQLVFRVNDIDTDFNGIEEVHTFYQDFGDLSPAVGFTFPETYYNNDDNRLIAIALSFRLTLNCTAGFTGLNCTMCADNYYGSDCAIFCEGRDDNTGHYTCSADGSRFCLDGYQNPNTDCVDCVPAPGCSPTGGFCESPSDCTCKDGYEGINCGMSTSSSVGVIIGPVVGSVAVILIIIVLGAILVLRKRQRKISAESPLDDHEMSSGSTSAISKGKEAATKTLGMKAKTVSGNAPKLTIEDLSLANPMYSINKRQSHNSPGLPPNGPDPKTSTMDSEQHDLENPLYDIDVPGSNVGAKPIKNKSKSNDPNPKTSTMDSEQHDLDNPLYDIDVPEDQVDGKPSQPNQPQSESAANYYDRIDTSKFQTPRQQPVGVYSYATVPGEAGPKPQSQPLVYDYSDPSATVRAVVTSVPGLPPNGPGPTTSTMDSEQHKLNNLLYDLGDIPGDQPEPGKSQFSDPDPKTSTMDSEQHDLDNPLYDIDVPGDRTDGKSSQPNQPQSEPAANYYDRIDISKVQTPRQQPVGSYSYATVPGEAGPKPQSQPLVYDYADPSATVRAVVTSSPAVQVSASSQQKPNFDPSQHYEFAPTADQN